MAVFQSPKMNSITQEDLCRSIFNEIQAGKGIVPLVGAGLSVPAGIPGTAELVLYLQLCVARALGLIGDSRWHPRLEDWPATRGSWAKSAREGHRKLIESARIEADALDDPPSKGRFTDVCRQAFGALTDWRLALQFLARIRQIGRAHV